MEDVVKCQVAFSKRRKRIIKKAYEISVYCDVDVAFVAFSPSGRMTKFCNRERIEDVLHRYVNTPRGSRLNHVGNVQKKMEKLENFDHIKGQRNKLHVIDKQIENFQLQIKKSGLELKILEAELSEYEVEEEQHHSLRQLSWCLRNINNSMEKIIAKKSELLFDNLSALSMQANPDGLSFPPTFTGNENVQIMEQLDWTIPYNSRVNHNMFQNFLHHSKYAPSVNFTDDTNAPVVYGSRPMVEFNSQTLPPQQTFVLDETLLNFPLQNNLNGWNNSHQQMSFYNATHNPRNSLYLTQPSRFTATTTMPIIDAPQYEDNTGTGLQFPNSNLTQFTNMDRGNNYGGKEGNTSEWKASDHQEAWYRVHTFMENDQDTMFDHNLQSEDGLGDNTTCNSNVEKCNLWEWQKLINDQNLI